MAENPELSPGPGDTRVPTPFPGEALLCARSGMQIQMGGIRGNKWSAKGSLYLSNVRMVFVAKEPDVTGLHAMDIPLVYIRGDKFNQPIFGCNNLAGDCWPVAENGGPSGSLPPHPYKLFFLEGGVGTFLPLYFRFLAAARQADRQQRLAGGAQQAQAVHEEMNHAFVDPNDPTSIFLTQPVSATTAQPPRYAANYGQDEAYQPMI